ncbi:PIN domain-containing protein [Nitrospiraceae bacterium AH_259_D15_M11_P09]|nr:PIN domain-containing protein [Nitrospiraceae bacterium AH_259_D15_M11_P09]
MKEVFADTAYWIALTNPTTDAVLVEYLNALAEKGARVRRAAIETVEAILKNPSVRVLPQTRRSFTRGFTLYKGRPDKGYSLTDCLSMTVMREHRLSSVLTTDKHFEQEGFVPLMISKARP